MPLCPATKVCGDFRNKVLLLLVDSQEKWQWPRLSVGLLSPSRTVMHKEVVVPHTWHWLFLNNLWLLGTVSFAMKDISIQTSFWFSFTFFYWLRVCAWVEAMRTTECWFSLSSTIRIGSKCRLQLRHLCRPIGPSIYPHFHIRCWEQSFLLNITALQALCWREGCTYIDPIVTSDTFFPIVSSFSKGKKNSRNEKIT